MKNIFLKTENDLSNVYSQFWNEYRYTIITIIKKNNNNYNILYDRFGEKNAISLKNLKICFVTNSNFILNYLFT